MFVVYLAINNDDTIITTLENEPLTIKECHDWAIDLRDYNRHVVDDTCVFISTQLHLNNK